MLGLPKTTEFNKRIPKQKFYEKMAVTPAIKKVFAEQIKMIYWRNKIAATTVNLAAGEKVSELQVFEILLNQPSLDEAALLQIDRALPYHVLFILTHDGKQQAWIAYKEAQQYGNAFKIVQYYHTDWKEAETLQLHFEGQSVDAVYENYVRQIAGQNIVADSHNLQNDVTRSEEIHALQKQIETLQERIRKEKQFNRQVEMNAEVKRLQKVLEEMEGR